MYCIIIKLFEVYVLITHRWHQNGWNKFCINLSVCVDVKLVLLNIVVVAKHGENKEARYEPQASSKTNVLFFCHCKVFAKAIGFNSNDIASSLTLTLWAIDQSSMHFCNFRLLKKFASNLLMNFIRRATFLFGKGDVQLLCILKKPQSFLRITSFGPQNSQLVQSMQVN